jgi:hypothetical protein
VVTGTCLYQGLGRISCRAFGKPEIRKAENETENERGLRVCKKVHKLLLAQRFEERFDLVSGEREGRGSGGRRGRRRREAAEPLFFFLLLLLFFLFFFLASSRLIFILSELSFLHVWNGRIHGVSALRFNSIERVPVCSVLLSAPCSVLLCSALFCSVKNPKILQEIR